MALVVPDKNAFQHILRLLNTNVDGKEKIMFALTRIKGVGRRYSNIVIKKADVDLNKRYIPNLQLYPICSQMVIPGGYARHLREHVVGCLLALTYMWVNGSNFVELANWQPKNSNE